MKHIKKCALLLLLSMMLTVICPFVPTVSSLGEESISAQTLAFPDIVYQLSEDVENFISRRSDLEEDLYTLAFENKDGTNTLKVFTHPVKYVDENGKLKDISNAVKRLSDGSYVTASNSIITTFARKLSDGITIAYDDIEINMVPSTPSGLAAVKYFFTGGRASSADNRTVSYDYGSETTLEYQLTYTGFKEDIVVSEYTGQTEYTFTLNTNGLYLRENDGSFYLADEKGVEKATIGDIIIFTADEKNNTFGSMTAKTVTEGEKYELTIHIDADFLKDSETAYPIRIDPSVEVISYENNGAGAIEDITVNTVDQLSATSGSLCLGKYGDDQSVSRVIMRFPGALFSEYPHPNLLISANVSLRDLIPNTSPTVVSCYSFNGNAWSEATGATWNGVGMNSSSALGVFQSSHSVSYGNGNAQTTAYRYEFDISKAAKLWLMGADSSKGLVFKASDTAEAGTAHVYKTFGSYNRASYKPVLTLNFRAVATTPPAVSNLDSEGNLIHCKVEDLVITADNTVSFRFTPTVTATYSLWTTGADYRDGVFINVFEHTVPLYCDMVGTTEDYNEGEDGGLLEEEDTSARSLTLELTATVTYCILIYDVDTPPTSDVDFHLVRGLPLSGSEKRYEPEKWNYGDDDDGLYDLIIQGYTNCYAYALNNHILPDDPESIGFLNPGMSSYGDVKDGETVMPIEGYELAENIPKLLRYIGYDSAEWGFEFKAVGRDEICAPGSYKVAFVVSYEYTTEDGFYRGDYHWYRQNDDGTWSHKPGEAPVTDKDSAGNTIFDPKKANRCTFVDENKDGVVDYILDYSIFVGYYSVTPLDNLLSSSFSSVALNSIEDSDGSYVTTPVASLREIKSAIID